MERNEQEPLVRRRELPAKRLEVLLDLAKKLLLDVDVGAHGVCELDADLPRHAAHAQSRERREALEDCNVAVLGPRDGLVDRHVKGEHRRVRLLGDQVLQKVTREDLREDILAPDDAHCIIPPDTLDPRVIQRMPCVSLDLVDANDGKREGHFRVLVEL